MIVPSPVPATGTAAQIGRALRPYLVPAGGHGAPAALDAAAIVHDQDGAPALDFWSRNVADESLQEMVGQAVADRMRAERLARAGLSPAPDRRPRRPLAQGGQLFAARRHRPGGPARTACPASPASPPACCCGPW
ncbi:MAG: hypothetical protein WDM92_09160 [Caulobacteraceae bacterium]